MLAKKKKKSPTCKTWMGKNNPTRTDRTYRELVQDDARHVERRHELLVQAVTVNQERVDEISVERYEKARSPSRILSRPSASVVSRPLNRGRILVVRCSGRHR